MPDWMPTPSQWLALAALFAALVALLATCAALSLPSGNEPSSVSPTTYGLAPREPAELKSNSRVDARVVLGNAPTYEKVRMEKVRMRRRNRHRKSGDGMLRDFNTIRSR